MDPEMERQDAKLKRERDQEDEQKDSSPKKTIRRKITVVRKQKITGNEGTDKTDKKSKEEEAAKRQLEENTQRYSLVMAVGRYSYVYVASDFLHNIVLYFLPGQERRCC